MKLGSTNHIFPLLRRRAMLKMYSTTTLEEVDLNKLRDTVKLNQFEQHEANPQLSPDLREKLNKEFNNFLKDFVEDVDPSLREAEMIAEKVSGFNASTFSSNENSKHLNGRHIFTSISRTPQNQPYSASEIYVRQLFHTRQVQQLGAEIINVYKPSNNLNNPKTIAETGVMTLLASGAHLGHATNKLRANCIPFVYGIRENIHIIDLQQTLAALRRVSKLVEDLSRRGGIILFVGTRDGQRRTVERAAKRSHGFYVYDRWIPGTLTNYQIMIDQKQKHGSAAHEVDMSDKATNRQLNPSLQDTIIKPDLVVVLNPVENRALLQECIKMRIPTTGIVDTDSEPSLLTYPIPGNDDSLRFVDLVSGVLSHAAGRGRANRLVDFKNNEIAKAKLKEGAVKLGEEGQDVLSEAEKQLL